MTTTEKTTEVEETDKHENERSQDLKDKVADGEFKLTVRKLEMPVRPRGVLAE